MVDMRMCQKNVMNQRRLHRQFTALKGLRPLLHSIIHQNIRLIDPKIMAAARNLVVRTDKHQFHRLSSFLRYINILPFFRICVQSISKDLHMIK